MKTSRMQLKCQICKIIPRRYQSSIPIMLQVCVVLLCQLLLVAQAARLAADSGSSSGNSFPGVSKELSSFCTGRPSLPIELASMIVHVKKNASFNYKLYLFSGEHVFQTGQVIPRDDFRIHSFPVRLKKLDQFWLPQVATLTYQNSSPESLSMIESSRFSLHTFLAPVDLISSENASPEQPLEEDHPAEGFRLPGEESESKSPQLDEANSSIKFDRDDQISVSRVPSSYLYKSTHKSSLPPNRLGTKQQKQQTILPIGSFSSFHVNLTYLVRKDFGQVEPELIRVQVDASEFSVSELVIISDGKQAASSYPRHPDYDFLTHNLLRDPNTRITSINQIYEDWITRNLYTIVYVQRRLSPSEEDSDMTSSSEVNSQQHQNIVSDRLIFRGSSRALLSADQLDYHVTAAAFITEKNGLHYYLEFLTSGKFYLCAIDWTKRPFKIIDSRRLPMKATRTQLDTEELLLCPPAPCYSSQPLDEIVTYGRLIENKTDYHRENLQPLLATQLHLRDWNWPLRRLAGTKNYPLNSRSPTSYLNISGIERHGAPFGWQYELARRNDIKVKPDTYGYALTGHEIDASYRVHNELYLVSANHLITINYTLENETVTSTHQIGLEFPGLSSTLLDPITGALYDQPSDQIYFFKGDRYLGFHYSTKKALEEFQLPAQSINAFSFSRSPDSSYDQQQPLISSLPVVGIFGRQHQVDGVFHDLNTDFIYIFTGMKYYMFKANEFKNGSFKPETQSLPQMHCINELFLEGCTFDEVHANPCKAERMSLSSLTSLPPSSVTLVNQVMKEHSDVEVSGGLIDNQLNEGGEKSHPSTTFTNMFGEQQQMKLRLIASRPRSILGFSLLGSSSADAARAALVQPLLDATNSQAYEKSMVADNERIVVYLLMALVSVATLISFVLLVLLITCAAQRRRITPAYLCASAHKYKPKQAQPANYSARMLHVDRQNRQFVGDLQLHSTLHPVSGTMSTQNTHLSNSNSHQLIKPNNDELQIRKCLAINSLVPTNKSNQKQLDSIDCSVL